MEELYVASEFLARPIVEPYLLGPFKVFRGLERLSLVL